MSDLPHQGDEISADDIQATAADIARQLDETNPVAIEQIVQHLGADAALAFLQEALEIEAQGGMQLPDGSRRRTPGGVFFYIIKGRVPRETRGLIWPHLGKKPKKKKQKIEPLPWEECLKLVPEALEHPGEATTVKITLIGRPGRIIEKGNVVLTTMQGTRAPTLPKGLPEPPDEPTTYVVYIARKQWRRVAEAIQDPQDKLIIEGYPAFDKRLEAITVFAMNVTTKNLQAARRQAQAQEQSHSEE
jgi:hypothetical protein